ncbi:MAG TPA: hydrogenase maturation protease [Terracidiphilus sp.]|nr:hydrogenase maturation protease [Terracidiphilus sp.]
MVASAKSRCLILACGNTLRGDDGAGPWLADWARRRFSDLSGFRVISRPQWTPELAEDIAGADAVLFVDCSLEARPGSISLSPVEPISQSSGLATHHLSAPELLALARDLYSALPRESLLLTIGAGSVALGEHFSDAVKAALPKACSRIEETVLRLLARKTASE